MEINKNICQLCQLKSVEEITETINEEDNGCVLSELFGNEIVEEMHLISSAICFECWNTIRQFHDLYQKVQIQFQNYKNLIITEHFIKEEPNTPSSSFCKIENLSVHNENITDETNCNIDVVDDDDNDDDDDDDDDNDNDDDDYDDHSDVKAASIRSSISSKTSSPILSSLPRKQQSQIKIKLKPKLINLKNVKKKLISLKRKTKNELNAENEQIKEYFKMSCDNCGDKCKFETIADARKHYRKQHKQSGHITCCNRKFFNRIRILEHISSAHTKSKTFRCEKCDKDFADKFALTNHMEDHAPLDQRQFKCDICKNSFTKLYKLTQHMQSAHIAQIGKKKSFNCGQCGNSFFTNSKLNTHIRIVHDCKDTQICEFCAKIFKSKSSLDVHLLKHNNKIIEQPKVQCKICGSWLKNELGLKKHMVRHNDGLQVCLICNKEAPNKYALNNHMQYVHSERKHKCSVCDKAFTQPIGLREHMASHTGQDLYTCTYCPKTFKSSGNMHSHRKKVHPTEWINDRQKK